MTPLSDGGMGDYGGVGSDGGGFAGEEAMRGIKRVNIALNAFF